MRRKHPSAHFAQSILRNIKRTAVYEHIGNVGLVELLKDVVHLYLSFWDDFINLGVGVVGDDGRFVFKNKGCGRDVIAIRIGINIPKVLRGVDEIDCDDVFDDCEIFIET